MNKIVMRDVRIKDCGGGILIEGFGHNIEMDSIRISECSGQAVELRVPSNLKSFEWYPHDRSDIDVYPRLKAIFDATTPEEALQRELHDPFWVYLKDKGWDIAQVILQIWATIKS